jgi:Domain of unknown function (DUF4136)
MIMETKSRSITAMVMLVILLAGCYPQGPEYVEDLDVVITDYEPSYDFSSKGTYAMPTRIVKITGDVVEGDEPQFIPDVTATAILAQIEKNMTALGWTRVPYNNTNPGPDVLLTPAAWETTTVLYYYDYWYWWYGGYYPYWGWGYPSYTTYSTGTLLMRMVDPDVLASNGLPVIQWAGAINGVLTYSYNATRINTALDRTFAQSPYLKTN